MGCEMGDHVQRAQLKQLRARRRQQAAAKLPYGSHSVRRDLSGRSIQLSARAASHCRAASRPPVSAALNNSEPRRLRSMKSHASVVSPIRVSAFRSFGGDFLVCRLGAEPGELA
jgi:hypothetical protein